VGLVADRDTQSATRAAQFVPRSVHRPAYDERPIVGRPEDHRLVAGRECTDPTGRARQPRYFVDRREAHAATRRPTHGFVFVQHGTRHRSSTGGWSEEHLAVGEVFGESLADGIDITLLHAEIRVIAAGALPRRGYRVVGVALRRCRSDGR